MFLVFVFVIVSVLLSYGCRGVFAELMCGPAVWLELVLSWWSSLSVVTRFRLVGVFFSCFVAVVVSLGLR